MRVFKYLKYSTVYSYPVIQDTVLLARSIPFYRKLQCTANKETTILYFAKSHLSSTSSNVLTLPFIPTKAKDKKTYT